jgi:import inner membrane translocase subunit TIM44
LQAEGLHEDPTILFVSEVELVEMRSVEDEPLVVAQFNCQQIKCTRDP